MERLNIVQKYKIIKYTLSLCIVIKMVMTILAQQRKCFHLILNKSSGYIFVYAKLIQLY